jgi:hypothetical protein
MGTKLHLLGDSVLKIILSICCIIHVATVPGGPGFLIIEALRSHSDTPHSVGLLWTSDQSDAETSALHHTTLTRDIVVQGDSNPQSQ